MKIQSTHAIFFDWLCVAFLIHCLHYTLPYYFYCLEYVKWAKKVKETEKEREWQKKMSENPPRQFYTYIVHTCDNITININKIAFIAVNSLYTKWKKRHTKHWFTMESKLHAPNKLSFVISINFQWMNTKYKAHTHTHKSTHSKYLHANIEFLQLVNHNCIIKLVYFFKTF